jgi:hypothetical protein
MKPVRISGSTSGAQTDYQVPVKVDHAPGMKADFSDVRFTARDGITILGFWKESHTPAGTALFYVKVPRIPAAPSTVSIYLYYGNARKS